MVPAWRSQSHTASWAESVASCIRCSLSRRAASASFRPVISRMLPRVPRDPEFVSRIGLLVCSTQRGSPFWVLIRNSMEGVWLPLRASSWWASQAGRSCSKTILMNVSGCSTSASGGYPHTWTQDGEM